MKRNYSSLAFIFMTLLVSGCSFNGFKSEEEITQALKNGKDEKVQNYIVRNIDDEEESDIVSFAIQSMVQEDKSENIKFIQDTFDNLVEDEEYETLETYAYYIDRCPKERCLDPSPYSDVVRQNKAYKDGIEKLKELQKELNSLETKKEKLVSEVPIDIPYQGKEIEGFSGDILQKINDSTYRVIHSVVNSEYILITNETVFTSTGSFAVLVIPGEVESLTLENGFKKDFQVLYEVPEQYKEKIDEINALTTEIESMNSEIGRYETIVNNNKDELKYIMKTWVETNLQVKENDDSSEVRDEDSASTKGSQDDTTREESEDPEILKQQLRLGMEKHEVESLLGPPTDELESNYTHPSWVYEGDVYINISWNHDWTVAEYWFEYSEGDNIIRYDVYSDGTEEERVF